MAPRTLIINGSPRPHGNTATLIEEMKKTLEGEVVEISAFRAKISPCVDCRHCKETAKCAVRDDMDIIYADDFDNLVLASPVWFGTLPGPVLNLISRFQPVHAAWFFLNVPTGIRPKKAGLILTAGSKHNEESAFHHSGCLFKLANARGFRDHVVTSIDTDIIPASEDEQALAGARELGRWLSEPFEHEDPSHLPRKGQIPLYLREEEQ